jgi:hypothetical protein
MKDALIMIIILMKLSRSILFVFCLFALILYSCIKPHEDTPQPPPEDPFQNYTRVESSLKSYPELGDFWCQQHFIIDSSIYVFGINKMAIFNLSGDLQSIKIIYSSDNGYHINKIKYDPENKLFFFVGSSNNDPFYSGFMNPLLLVFDLQGNLVFEDIYAWNGRQNYFEDILLSPQKEPVILTADLVGPSWDSKWVNTLLFLNSSFDSVNSVEIPFDSCSYSYFDYRNDSVVQFVGEKTDSIAYASSYTHTIYAEMSISGDPIKMIAICPSDGGLYIENSTQLDIYHWTNNDNWWQFNMKLDKFSEAGALDYSREIELLKKTSIDPVTEVYIIPENDAIIVYGAMDYIGYYTAPVFYGHYIVKIDDSGKELYRILFNDDLKGYVMTGSCLSVLGDNHYIFLFTFYNSDSETFSFCISEVKVE